MAFKLKDILPETVHVILSIPREETHNDPWPGSDYNTIEVPLKYIQHNERGHYNEWEFKEYAKKKLIEQHGEKWISAHIQGICEFSILENIALMLKDAKKCGFNAMAYINKFPLEEARYSHTIDTAPKY
jgi:hypothetical protein